MRGWAILIVASALAGCTGALVQPASLPLPSLGCEAPACEQGVGGEWTLEFVAAANPQDPMNAIISGNGARRAAATPVSSDPRVQWWTTHDGGATWEEHTMVPQRATLPRVLPGTSTFMGDTYVAFAPDGTAYLASIWYNTVLRDTQAGTWSNLVLVARSDDGGDSFGEPVAVESRATDVMFHDRPSLAVDPDGRVYATWIMWDDAKTKADQWEGGMRLAMSEDRGETWTLSFVTEDLWSNHATLAADKDGVVHAMLLSGTEEMPNALFAFRSTDHGASWSEPTLVRPMRDPAWTAPGREYRIPDLPILAALPDGTLLATVHDLSEKGDMDAMLLRSEDSGATWSATRLNGDATANDQFMPTIAADASGTVAALWLDRRDDPEDLRYRPWVAVSRDGGRTFVEQAMASAMSPRSGDGPRWIGDTIGVAVSGDRVYAAWPDLRDGDGTVPRLYAGALRLA